MKILLLSFLLLSTVAEARFWNFITSGFEDTNSLSLAAPNGNGAVSAAGVGQFNISAAQSLCFWANSAGGPKEMLATTDTTLGGGYNFFNNDGTGIQPEFQLIDQSINYIGKRSVTIASGGAFHFVCGTYDGSITEAGIKIYIDGVAVSMTSLSSPSPPDNTFNAAGNPMCIGCQIKSATSTTLHVFQGYIDLVGQWNVELSGADITRLYNGGAPYNYASDARTANLVYFYRLGEGLDTTGNLFDSSGNGHTLTCTGCTLPAVHP